MKKIIFVFLYFVVNITTAQHLPKSYRYITPDVIEYTIDYVANCHFRTVRELIIVMERDVGATGTQMPAGSFVNVTIYGLFGTIDLYGDFNSKVTVTKYSYDGRVCRGYYDHINKKFAMKGLIAMNIPQYVQHGRNWKYYE